MADPTGNGRSLPPIDIPQNPPQDPITQLLALFTQLAGAKAKDLMDMPIKASEIGFFYPNYPGSTDNVLTTTDNKTIYRDVFTFCNRLANVITLQGWHNIIGAVNNCLIGEAYV